MIISKTVKADLEGLAVKIDREVMKEGFGCTHSDHHDINRDGARLFVASYVKTGLLGKTEMSITLSYFEAAGQVTVVADTIEFNKGTSFKKGNLIDDAVLNGIENACLEYSAAYEARKKTRGRRLKVHLPHKTKHSR